MPHGGARPGAGRKPGGLNRKTREIADRAAAEGITPLEVMLQAMRSHLDGGRLDQAAAVAKDAAPYMHPRLASVDNTVTVTRSERELTDDELEAIVRSGSAGADGGPMQ